MPRTRTALLMPLYNEDARSSFARLSQIDSCLARLGASSAFDIFVLSDSTKEEAAAAPKTRVKVDYEIGDSVKVLEGPFASFNGIVEELDFDKSKVKVSVSIFGRATPVELDFEQVERVK